jgi:hypothetical protein
VHQASGTGIAPRRVIAARSRRQAMPVPGAWTAQWNARLSHRRIAPASPPRRPNLAARASGRRRWRRSTSDVRLLKPFGLSSPPAAPAAAGASIYTQRARAHRPPPPMPRPSATARSHPLGECVASHPRARRSLPIEEQVSCRDGGCPPTPSPEPYYGACPAHLP